MEYTDVSLDLSPLEVEKLTFLLTSVYMLNIGDKEFIKDLLTKLKK